MASGAAIIEASEAVIENGRKIAAHVLEAGGADIEFDGGRFSIAGTDRGIGIMELAARLRQGIRAAGGRAAHAGCAAGRQAGALGLSQRLPRRRGRDRSRDRRGRGGALRDGQRFRRARSIRCWSQGQAHGGIVQGIGQALKERVVYDEDGQPLTGPTWTTPAARRRRRRPSPSAAIRCRRDQPARRQGLRRGRLRRLRCRR